MRRFLSSLAVAGAALLVSTSPVTVSADAGAAAAAANAGIKATLKSLDYRYFVAGGVCAATSHGITCPIDVVKTKIQAQPEVRRSLKKVLTVAWAGRLLHLLLGDPTHPNAFVFLFFLSYPNPTQPARQSDHA